MRGCAQRTKAARCQQDALCSRCFSVGLDVLSIQVFFQRPQLGEDPRRLRSLGTGQALHVDADVVQAQAEVLDGGIPRALPPLLAEIHANAVEGVAPPENSRLLSHPGAQRGAGTDGAELAILGHRASVREKVEEGEDVPVLRPRDRQAEDLDLELVAGRSIAGTPAARSRWPLPAYPIMLLSTLTMAEAETGARTKRDGRQRR